MSSVANYVQNIAPSCSLCGIGRARLCLQSLFVSSASPPLVLARIVSITFCPREEDALGCLETFVRSQGLFPVITKKDTTLLSSPRKSPLDVLRVVLFLILIQLLSRNTGILFLRDTFKTLWPVHFPGHLPLQRGPFLPWG